MGLDILIQKYKDLLSICKDIAVELLTIDEKIARDDEFWKLKRIIVHGHQEQMINADAHTSTMMILTWLNDAANDVYETAYGDIDMDPSRGKEYYPLLIDMVEFIATYGSIKHREFETLIGKSYHYRDPKLYFIDGVREHLIEDQRRVYYLLSDKFYMFVTLTKSLCTPSPQGVKIFSPAKLLRDPVLLYYYYRSIGKPSSMYFTQINATESCKIIARQCGFKSPKKLQDRYSELKDESERIWAIRRYKNQVLLWLQWSPAFIDAYNAADKESNADFESEADRRKRNKISP